MKRERDLTDIKLAERLAEIIGMLNNGEGINTSLLAERFNVSKRTIQRDIHERLSFLDIDKSQPLWALQKNKAGKLNKGIINKFAEICGVKELFPVMDEHFLKELTSEDVNSPYLVKASNYEDSFMPTYRHQFRKLANAIKSQYQIDFYYNGKEYKQIQPYKLISYQGYWYLAAQDDGNLKTFHVGLIEILWPTNVFFVKRSDIEKRIKEDKTVWIGTQKTEVRILIRGKVAHYFKRKSILPEQQVVEEKPCGDLVITAVTVNDYQILPIIRAWIPNIEIISPMSLAKKLNDQLAQYIKEK